MQNRTERERERGMECGSEGGMSCSAPRFIALHRALEAAVARAPQATSALRNQSICYQPWDLTPASWSSLGNAVASQDHGHQIRDDVGSWPEPGVV